MITFSECSYSGNDKTIREFAGSKEDDYGFNWTFERQIRHSYAYLTEVRVGFAWTWEVYPDTRNDDALHAVLIINQPFLLICFYTLGWTMWCASQYVEYLWAGSLFYAP